MEGPRLRILQLLQKNGADTVDGLARAIGLAPATPDGFRMAGSFRVKGSGSSWAHPVVANGRLYLRYADNLYCFDVRKK